MTRKSTPAAGTNITREHRKTFRALTSNRFGNFVLFSCFVNGEPSAAICALHRDGDNFRITPMFVAVTAKMRLNDHSGDAI